MKHIRQVLLMMREEKLFSGIHIAGTAMALAFTMVMAKIIDCFLIGEVGLRKFCIKRLLDIVNSFTHSMAKFRKIATFLHVFRGKKCKY